MSPAEVWRRERIPGTPLPFLQPGFDGSSRSPLSRGSRGQR